MNAQLTHSKSIGPLTVHERAVLVFKSAKTAEELKALAAQSVTIISITNPDGLEQVKRARITLKNARLEVERIGDDGRADAVAVSKAIIAQQKLLVGLVKSEEDRLQALQDAWDAKVAAEKEARVQAELLRQKALRERIVELHGCPTLTPTSGSALISDHISDLEAIAIDDSWEEFKDQAESAKVAGLARLNAILAAAVAHEAEQKRLADERAELARLRAEQAERDAAAAEQRRKQEAIDKAAREAEAKARAQAEAEAKAIREAEEARIGAERAENARLAAEAKAELDRQAREVHERQVQAAREHAQQLAAQKAESDRIAAERQAELDAKSAQVEADRLKVEAERDALLAAKAPKIVVEAPPLELSADPVSVTANLDSTDDIWWSDDGESYRYQSLSELIDCQEVEIGSIVYYATAIFPDPTEWVRADDIIERLSEGAGDEHGEFAEGYPDISDEAKAELQTLLDTWIMKYAQPSFFNIKDSREYVITREDLDQNTSEVL